MAPRQMAFYFLTSKAVIEIPGRMFRVEVEHIAQKDVCFCL